ncbi:hypothetical protein E5675_05420 [Sphingopyxis sp. PAMC25046]|uniref:hypothetical protein n=1 Tax=Sphingopyxis sp. PAMC25046 TaxID=2565556 RepID=UPI00109E10B1|nr:hypothetical protein [Sphingopyxis sp. PAMC25046]QCB53926.1 hypothetical protein E5675_05420 [Sphingopyxis sp. PAMC25046]
MIALSPLRARLASFDHAYAVAIQLRGTTGRGQFILWTGNPIQPFRVSPTLPPLGEQLLVWVA